MSIIKKYNNGETELNKFRYKPTMSQGSPPLVTKRIPTGENPIPVENNEFTRRADDLSRISQLFGRREGVKFTSNNFQLGTAVDLSYTVQGSLKDKFKAIQDINLTQARTSALQTIVTTLAQVPVAGTGTHFIKGKLFGKPEGPIVSKTTANIGRPGEVKVKYGRDSVFDTAPESYGVDQINAISPYDGTQVKAVDDYIKFYFQVLRPGEQKNIFLHFRAFLDNFNDSYNGTWNSFNYIGRGEAFHTYQSFNRSINVSFKSAVATKQELAPVYQKLVYLASTTAPTYSNSSAETVSFAANGQNFSVPIPDQSGGIMRGTIVRMTIGDYLYDTPGYISNVTYNWESNFPFEIKKEVAEGSYDEGLQELPHMLQCSLTFTPIHTFTPQTGLYHYITSPEADTQDKLFFTPPGEDYKGGVENIPSSKNNRG